MSEDNFLGKVPSSAALKSNINNLERQTSSGITFVIKAKAPEEAPIFNLPEDMSDTFGTDKTSISVIRMLFVVWGDGTEKDKLVKDRFSKIIDFAESGYQCGLKENRVVSLAMQYEKAPTTGRIHIQGFMRFERKVKTSTIWKKLEFNFPIFIAKCFKDEPIIKYCTKTEQDCINNPKWKDKGGRVEGTEPFVFGEQNLGQGKMNMHFVKERLLEGESCEQIIWKYPQFAGRKRDIKALIQAQIAETIEKRDKNVRKTCYCLIGDAGLGKDLLIDRLISQIREKNPGFKRYNHNGSKWFCTYMGQEIIYTSEFKYKTVPIQELMKYTDPYRCYQGETKCGDPTDIWPYFMFFTSNVHPENWYNVRNRDSVMERDPTKQTIEQHEFNAIKRRFWILEMYKDINGGIAIKDHGDPDPPKPIKIAYDERTGKEFTINFPKIITKPEEKPGAIWTKIEPEIKRPEIRGDDEKDYGLNNISDEDRNKLININEKLRILEMLTKRLGPGRIVNDYRQEGKGLDWVLYSSERSIHVSNNTL